MKLTRRKLLTGAGITAAVGLGTATYAVAVEPNMVAVTRYAPKPKSWPSDLPLRIVALSDIHASEPWLDAARLTAICEKANALEPDIILLLGDYRSGMRMTIREVPVPDWVAALTTLKAPLGVHAILGNHDWWDDLAAQRSRRGPVMGRRMLERVGIPVYENDAVRLEKDGHAFWLAGLGDQLAFVKGLRRRRRRGPRGIDDLPGTLAKISDGAPVILLAHEPDIFPQVPDRVSLTLSGHTHGGQVRLFGYSPRVPSRFGNRFAYGHIVEDNRHLIVSGGLGCSVLPVRIGVPPEVVMVDVSAAAHVAAPVAARAAAHVAAA